MEPATKPDPAPLAAEPCEPPAKTVWSYLRAPLAVLIAVAMSCGSFWLFIQNNDFPLYYHPDESSKVMQILDQDQPRNFNHPLLMLESASLAWQWTRDHPSFAPKLQNANRSLEAAVVGRSTSAALAAIGVFGLALASYLAYGYVGLLIGGAVMMLCPPLLVYAHYFKEDASLVAGIMVAVLGARLVLSGRNEWMQMLAAIVLGIGAGAAASGKYVGAVTLVPCLLVLLIAPIRNWTAVPIRIFMFMLVAAATVVFINQRGFTDWKALRIAPFAQRTVEEEFEHGTSGHNGLTLAPVNAFCLRIAASEVMPHLWVLGGIGAVWLIYRRRITRWGIVVAAFLLTWAAALSMNRIPFGRYALPITVMAYFALAQLACFAIGDWLKRLKLGIVATVVALVGTLQLSRCMRINHQVLDDSRQRLYEWAATNLRTGSAIVAENYTALDYAGDLRRHPDQSRQPPRVINVGFACNFASSPEQLAMRGFDYVAVAAPDYDRFFAPGVHRIGDPADAAPPGRRFYEELFARGELVWAAYPDPDTHAYINPELRVYRITNLRRAR